MHVLHGMAVLCCMLCLMLSNNHSSRKCTALLAAPPQLKLRACNVGEGTGAVWIAW